MSIEELKSLTSKERIILYLSEFHNLEERYELPADVIQQSIAYGTGVQRKHLSQYLDLLIEEDMIVERKAHIQGMKQRMNGYYLTPGGYIKAKELRKKVEEVVVPILMNGSVKEMRVADIDDATSAHITLCDIVREAIASGDLRISALEQVEQGKRLALEAREQDTEVYKRALLTAWRDGRVTATERFLVEELRKHLNVTEEQHRVLEAEIVKRLAQDHMEFRRIYRTVLEVALADRAISGPEESILEGLRRVMRISRKEHDEMVKEVELSYLGPTEPEKDLQREAMRLVRAQ